MKKILCVLLLVCSSNLFAFSVADFYKPKEKSNVMSVKDRDKIYHDAIRLTLYLTHKYIKNVTDDNEINCMDWSLVFYAIWNIIFVPEGLYKCEIVVNRYADFDHAFIGIYIQDFEENEYGKYAPVKKKLYMECIEPQAKHDRPYLMNYVWKNKYDPKYNVVDTANYMYWYGVPRLPEREILSYVNK